MKNTTATIALAIATLATGSAFAGDFSTLSAWENFGKQTAVQADSGKTRDQVQAELAASKTVSTGNFGSGLSTWAKYNGQAVESGKTRAEVQAELAASKTPSTGNFGSGLSTWAKYGVPAASKSADKIASL